ncbi:MAG: hypothetical protein ABI950_12415, partial [Solirubrobacteraceae bacterium]
GKGTKSKPVPVGVGYTMNVSTADGSRPEAVKQLTEAWEGVRSYGKYFPKCTAAQIAAAQSDKVCPKGSLVGTGKVHSLVAPLNDFSTQGATCDRDTHTYNAGQNKVTVIFTGPGDKCLGTAYTSPFSGKWSDTGGIGGGQATITIPPREQTYPVPGVLVSTTQLSFTFPKRVITVKGKKVSYLMSVGCKGKRSAKLIYQGQPKPETHTITASAGSC